MWKGPWSGTNIEIFEGVIGSDVSLQLLPTRTDWTGQKHFRSYEELVRTLLFWNLAEIVVFKTKCQLGCQTSIFRWRCYFEELVEWITNMYRLLGVFLALLGLFLGKMWKFGGTLSYQGYAWLFVTSRFKGQCGPMSLQEPSALRMIMRSSIFSCRPAAVWQLSLLAVYCVPCFLAACSGGRVVSCLRSIYCLPILIHLQCAYK